MTWYCMECGYECERAEITFDYAGTHCTGGAAGTHHTGEYESTCCGAEVSDDWQDFDPKYDDSTFANHSGRFADND